MNESKATRYQRLRRRAQASSWCLAGAALAAVAFTPAGSALYRVATALAPVGPGPAQSAIALVLFVAMVIGLCATAALPAVWYQAARIDPAYGRSGDDPIRNWLAGALMTLAGAVAGAGVVWVSALTAGRAWWLVAGMTLSATLVLAVRAGPWLLARFATVQPLNRPGLEARISSLLRGAGLPEATIQELVLEETSPTIALVAGFGRSRRVLVASDVARNWSEDEVVVIVAHELAHHVHHDLRRTLGLNAALLCTGLWLCDVVLGVLGPSSGAAGAVVEPASMPVIAFVAGGIWLAATPLRHAQSRRQERQADRFALATTGHVDAFAAAIRRASGRHLIEDRPGPIVRWFYHHHPPLAERLELAEGHRWPGAIERARR